LLLTGDRTTLQGRHVDGEIVRDITTLRWEASDGQIGQNDLYNSTAAGWHRGLFLLRSNRHKVTDAAEESVVLRASKMLYVKVTTIATDYSAPSFAKDS
jgi:hypothetical protein